MSNSLRVLAVALALMAGDLGAQAQTSIPPLPKDFVMAASQGDQYEVYAAEAAAVQGQDPRVRTFAKEMVQDHSRLSDALRQAAEAAKLPPPTPGMSSDQAALLGSLQSLRGQEFDKAYVRQQVLAHTQAVAIHESFAASGANPDLRKAAQAALPTIREHQKKAEQLRVDLGGS